ncbi:MAG: L-threonylcarbamoyladenylate synthase [Pseudomonadota bacterium]
MTSEQKNTIRLSPTERGVRAGAYLLGEGEVVAFPTETVYGLGADARNPKAVARIYAAKGRPSYNPLIVHVADLAAARALVEMPPLALSLANAFWPGPLTLVLPAIGGTVADAVRAGLPTLAVRVPAHPLAQALIRATGAPLAAPSANPSGHISPTTADHVMDALGGKIAAVLDDGPCAVGVESTIVGFQDRTPVLLRPGGVPLDALTAKCGVPILAKGAGGEVSAPGQLASHYAPRLPMRLNATRPEGRELWLAFGALGGYRGLTLSETKDLNEAAANLFAHMHRLDEVGAELGATGIAVASVPAEGLGLAINDRLSRAAADRPAQEA